MAPQPVSRKTAASLSAALSAHQAGRFAEAERLYRKILRADPEQAETLQNLGALLNQTGAPERALGFLERALRAGGGAGAEATRASVLVALNRHEEAVAALDQALQRYPGDAMLHYNRGTALLALERFAEAAADFARSSAIRPDGLDDLTNYALALTRLGRYREALEVCDRALAIAPKLVSARRHAAGLALALGDYERGWQEYEWRWLDPEASIARRHFTAPRWTGAEAMSGRTLLLHAEQGLGDTIQFARFVPLLRGLSGRIVLEAPAPLLPLLRTLPGVAEWVAAGTLVPHYDYHTSLMSLPAIFRTRLDNIPAAVPYLHPDPGRVADWQAWLGPRRGRRVGLAWSGSTTFAGDKDRSAPLAALCGLAAEQIELIAIQPDMRPGDQAAAEAMGIRMTAGRLTDFGETAALAACLDLVISVDSAPAHLAGAIGRPLWVMLPFVVEWRWLIGRTDSPWYPTARLFRQPKAGDWASVVAAMRAALHETSPA